MCGFPPRSWLCRHPCLWYSTQWKQRWKILLLVGNSRMIKSMKEKKKLLNKIQHDELAKKNRNFIKKSPSSWKFQRRLPICDLSLNGELTISYWYHLNSLLGQIVLRSDSQPALSLYAAASNQPNIGIVPAVPFLLFMCQAFSFIFCRAFSF